jgi:DNA/RNA-binding domain of Phe-tRNA-synthetase-like protein
MIALAPGLRPIITPGVLAFDDVRVAESDSRLDGPLAASERQVRANPPVEKADVRAMYRAVGIDPTRRRPSSEALLRRVLKGEPLPRINSLVDICNWCSLEFQLPYGLYDRERIEGAVELRLGRDGEQYPGIRKDEVHVGGRLTLADARGPFGNPSSDSARTMVTTAARSVLVVVFAPARLRPSDLAAVLAATSDRILEFAGGTEVWRGIIEQAQAPE